MTVYLDPSVICVLKNTYKLATLLKGDPKAAFSIASRRRCKGGGATPFPGLLHFTLDPYLIMLSVKQVGIKYYFLSLWYDSIWDWTLVSRTIGEYSIHQANEMCVWVFGLLTKVAFFWKTETSKKCISILRLLG